MIDADGYLQALELFAGEVALFGCFNTHGGPIEQTKDDRGQPQHAELFIKPQYSKKRCQWFDNISNQLAISFIAVIFIRYVIYQQALKKEGIASNEFCRQNYRDRLRFSRKTHDQ